MKKIALIYMGGTFGCVNQPLSPLTFAEFSSQLKAVGLIEAHIDCYSAGHIKDSSTATGADWLELAQQIQALQQQGYQHFVVLHGTDTMSYAGAVLARCLGNSCHLVITGSQYPLFIQAGHVLREHSDAKANLELALLEVIRLPAGCYLAFAKQIFYAQSATKIHTTALEAFTGIEVKHAFQAAEKPFKVQNAHIQNAQKLNIVHLVAQPILPNFLTSQLELISQQPPDALVIQAFGSGNLAMTASSLTALEQIQQQGCLIILTTQVLFGEVDQRYEVSQWLKNTQILIDQTASHADLYAKILMLYIGFDEPEQRYHQWPRF